MVICGECSFSCYMYISIVVDSEHVLSDVDRHIIVNYALFRTVPIHK